MSETGFQVEERDGEIIVLRSDPLFIATYYKKTNEPQLILRRRFTAPWQAALCPDSRPRCNDSDWRAPLFVKTGAIRATQGNCIVALYLPA
jgi:hypothetical protein